MHLHGECNENGIHQKKSGYGSRSCIINLFDNVFSVCRIKSKKNESGWKLEQSDDVQKSGEAFLDKDIPKSF